jgi:hypothetical protein
MNVFYYLLGEIQTTEESCECCGTLRQMDARLPDNTPIRILQSDAGYHVAVGVPGEFPPPAVPGADVFAEIFAQWWQVSS